MHSGKERNLIIFSNSIPLKKNNNCVPATVWGVLTGFLETVQHPNIQENCPIHLSVPWAVQYSLLDAKIKDTSLKSFCWLVKT